MPATLPMLNYIRARGLYLLLRLWYLRYILRLWYLRRRLHRADTEIEAIEYELAALHPHSVDTPAQSAAPDSEASDD